MSAGGAFQERSRGGLPLPVLALLRKAQPFSSGRCFQPQHGVFTGCRGRAGCLLPSGSPKRLKPKPSRRGWRQRWSWVGEKETTPLPRNKILPILAFFSQFLLARCSPAVSLIVKQVPGCPLASRAGRMGCLLWLCKHLQTVWETSPSCLLLSCLPLALASRCASTHLGFPSSSSFWSHVIICQALVLQKGKERVSWTREKLGNPDSYGQKL